MNRRSRWVVPTLVYLLTVPPLAGCETLRQSRRARDDDHFQKAASADNEPGGDKVLDVQSSLEERKPFFKPSRLSGAMSSEGREIERDLGIH
jgi:hypothetical protein